VSHILINPQKQESQRQFIKLSKLIFKQEREPVRF